MTDMLKGIFLTLILCLPSIALAEQMVLKSGEKLEVNIIDESPLGVKVDYKGAVLIYYPFEIDAIDGKPLNARWGIKQQEDKSAPERSVGSEEYLKRGRVLNDKGNYEFAISNFNKALKIDGNLAPAYLGRGMALANEKKPEKAIADYSKAIELNGKNEEAFYIRGLAYSQKGDPDSAMADFDKAVSLNPKYIQPYLNKALLNINKKDFVSAISDMDKVIKIDADVPPAYYARGTAYANKGNFEQAIADYSKAISLNPKYAEAYVNRGLAYLYKIKLDATQNGQYGQYSPKIFIDIGVTASNKADFDKALSDASKAIEINPKYPDGYAARINVYMFGQQYGKAQADVKKLEELGLKPDPQLVKELEDLAQAKNNR